MQEIIAHILELCKEIVALKLIIHEARGGRLQRRCVELTIRLRTKQHASEDGLILLKTCFEDILDYLKRFCTKNRDLAVKVIKDGSGEVHFVKLNEQLLNCCTILDIKIDRNEPQDLQDLEEDCVVLKANLNSILEVFATGPEMHQRKNVILPAFDHGILKMIERQKAERPTYKSKRAPEESLDILAQNLNFIKPIGRGGFSTIWLGKYKDRDLVAIKLFNIDSSRASLEEFQNEAEIMRRLSHRNITAYYGVAETEKGFTMVMEYMENDSLFTYMKNNKSNPFDSSKKVDIALDIARGIDYLHRLRIIHRDLKMGNVLLDSCLNAKISDFGLSIVKDAQISIIPLLEAGTSSYMAPETFGAGALYSSKSDIFAFGILLWGIIHWSQPFGGINREEVRQLVWKERYRLPISTEVPRPISSVISCCWSQNPAHRPSMSEVKEFLERVVMIEGLITQNEIFSFEMTTQATEMDPTVKVTPASVNVLNSHKPAPLQKSISAIHLKEHVLQRSMSGLRPAPQIPQSVRKAANTEEIFSPPESIKPEHARRANTLEDISIGSQSSKQEMLAVRKAPSAPNDAHQLDLKRNLVAGQEDITVLKYVGKSEFVRSPSGTPSQEQPVPVSLVPNSSAQASHWAQNSLSGRFFQPKSSKLKHETVPKKQTFGRRQKLVIAVSVAITVVLLIVAIVLAIVYLNPQSKSSVETVPTTSPSPTCKLESVNFGLQCKTMDAVVTTFAGSSRGNTNGDRITAAEFRSPRGLAFHPDGSLIITDYFGIRNISGDFVYPLAVDNSNFDLSIVRQISIDTSGVLYVPSPDGYIVAIDTFNSSARLFAGNLTMTGDSDNTDLLKSTFENPWQTLIYNNSIFVVNRGSLEQSGSIKILDECLYTENPGTRTFLRVTGNYKPRAMAIDANGDIYYSTDHHCISKFIVSRNASIECFAGTPFENGSGDGRPGVGKFNRPEGLAFDGCGNLFVADRNNDMIRMVDKLGVISTAVNSNYGLNSPSNLAFGKSGELYVTDTGSHRIKKVTFS